MLYLTYPKILEERIINNSYCLMSVADMLNLPIGKLLSAYSHLITFSQVITIQSDVSLPERDYKELLGSANDLLDACNEMGLLVTKSATSDLIKEMKLAVVNNGHFGFRDGNFLRLKNYLLSMQHCMQHESTLKVALILPPDKAELFESSNPLFGSNVDTQFPSISYEISESGKCMALGRSTASVFHSIRCLESGIRAISRCLGIPDPTRASERSWHKMLEKVKAEIERRWPTASNKLSGDGQLFDGLYGALAAIQNPYRNSTMHLDQIYTEDDANHIFVMVGGFMKKIASKMDEQGLPRA